METNNNTDRLQEIGIFFLSVFISGVAAFLYGYTAKEITNILIMSSVSTGCVIFAIEEGRISGGFLFDNRENLWRFTILYFFFLTGRVVFPMFPAGGWPYVAIFTGLMLFSGQLIAVCAGCNLLFISMLLSPSSSTDLFVIYFISGMAGVLLFSALDESFRVWLPLMIALMVQFIGLSLHEVLLVNEAFHPEMFLVPAVNILINLILLLILLKFFSFSIIYRTRDTYMDINDPECPLLVKLKEFSKEEYFHAIHTAYLCDRIAKKLSLDDAAAKAGGYYHKIGILKGENSFENVKLVLEDYEIPDKVMVILEEYLNKDEDIVSKETAILLISDTIISSISYLFSKDANASLDYEKLIQAVFKKKMDSGILNHNNLSLRELEEIKKILMEEKLYYDFLR